MDEVSRSIEQGAPSSILEIIPSKMVNDSNSNMDAQVSYGVGPLSSGSLRTFQKEVETIFGQGVKFGVLGIDSGQDNSSGFGVEITNSR